MNTKTGFAWYYVDTDRYQDIKIKRLKKEHGCEGVAVLDFLLCEIYRDKGYFLQWNEAQRFNVAEYFNLSETLVNQIVTFCAETEIFNAEILQKTGILTSSAIQKRAVLWAEKARRNPYLIPEALNLLTNEAKMYAISPQNAEQRGQNVDSLPRRVSRVEYSRVSRGGTEETNPTAATDKKDFLELSKKEKIKMASAERAALKMPYRGADFVDTWHQLLKTEKWQTRGAAQLQQSLNELGRFDKNFALLLMQKCIAGGYSNLIYEDTAEKFKAYKNGKNTKPAPAASPKAQTLTNNNDKYARFN